jgi:hypothetical protein
MLLSVAWLFLVSEDCPSINFAEYSGCQLPEKVARNLTQVVLFGQQGLSGRHGAAWELADSCQAVDETLLGVA